MTTLADYTDDVEALVHDLAQIDFKQPEYTRKINKARKKVAMDFHCVRNLFSGLNFIAGQEQYPLSGGVGGIAMLSGGFNYSNPIIAFSGGGGAGARAVATILNGAVSAPQMTAWGAGYSSTPDVVIVDGPNGYVSMWALRRAIAAYPYVANPASLVSAAIVSLPPSNQAWIIWNSGGWSLPGDPLWLVVRTALAATNPQMASTYAQAAREPNIVSTPTEPGQTIGGQSPPSSPGQTATGYPSVSNQQFRLAMAQPPNDLSALVSSIPSDPADPANMIYTSGAPTCFGDPLSAVLVGSLGFSQDQALSLYQLAATKPNSLAAVTNQQLKTALADPSYNMLSAAISAISASVSDPVNIQWNSGAGSSLGDALSAVIGTLTFPGGKSLTTLYSLAASLPKPQSGSGASAQAIVLRNVLDVVDISMVWTSLRPALCWMPFDIFQAYARSSVYNPLGQPSVYTTMREANRLYIYQIPDQLYGLEIDCVCLPDELVNTSDVDTQIPDDLEELVAYQAAHNCMMKNQQYQQSGFYEREYDKKKAELQSTRYTLKRWNVYTNMSALIGRMF